MRLSRRVGVLQRQGGASVKRRRAAGVLAERPGALHRSGMQSTLNRIMWGFLAAFFVLVAAVMVYQVVWAWPAQRCIQAHKWWDPDKRICATPIDLRVFTRRPNVAPPAIGPGAKPQP